MKNLLIITAFLACTGCTQSRTLAEWHDNHPNAGFVSHVNNEDKTTTQTFVFPFHYTHTGHPMGQYIVTDVTEMHQAVITANPAGNIIKYERTVVDWGN